MADLPRRPQSFKRNNETVESAKPLTMIKACMMKPTRQCARNAIRKSLASSGKNTPTGQAYARKQLRTPWKLLRLRQRARLTRFHRRYVVGSVYTQQIILRDRIGRIDRYMREGFFRLRRHQCEFRDRHDVIADRRRKFRIMKKGHLEVGGLSGIRSLEAG